MTTDFRLDGKVAVVTGATGGIGSEICRVLAAQGCTVVVGYNRSRESADALLAELPPTVVAHMALAMPVKDSSALQLAAEQTLENLGRVDILVNCAGTTRAVPHHDLDALDDSLIDDILATNVRGAFATIRAFKSALAANGPGGGLVVNISSIAARTANGSNVIYAASKAALDNMTLSLARALAPEVRVLSVSPGLVMTDFIKQMDAEWAVRQNQLTPLGRLAEARDIARAVLAAATLMSFSTGTVLAVDGGRPLL